MKSLVVCYLAFLIGLNGYSQDKRSTELKFRKFKVVVVDFIVEDPAYFERLPKRSDTIEILENPCNEDGAFIDNTLFKIRSRFHKRDSFSLSLAYKIFIYELPESAISKQEGWTYFSEYRTPPQESRNSLQIPAPKVKYYLDVMKKNYGLRDTSAKGSVTAGSYDSYLTRDGKVFSWNWDSMYLRICRFKRTRLKQCEYIKVKLLIKGCD